MKKSFFCDCVRFLSFGLYFFFDVKKLSQVANPPSLILEGFQLWRWCVHFILIHFMFCYLVVSCFNYLFIPFFVLCREVLWLL